jgi:hypothetical protein
MLVVSTCFNMFQLSNMWCFGVFVRPYPGCTRNHQQPPWPMKVLAFLQPLFHPGRLGVPGARLWCVVGVHCPLTAQSVELGLAIVKDPEIAVIFDKAPLYVKYIQILWMCISKFPGFHWIIEIMNYIPISIPITGSIHRTWPWFFDVFPLGLVGLPCLVVNPHFTVSPVYPIVSHDIYHITSPPFSWGVSKGGVQKM